MDRNIHKIFTPRKDPTESDETTAPWYFRNRDLLRHPNAGKTISQKKLLNLWNRIHFMEGMVYVHLHHPQYKEDLLIPAYPDPCGLGSLPPGPGQKAPTVPR